MRVTGGSGSSIGYWPMPDCPHLLEECCLEQVPLSLNYSLSPPVPQPHPHTLHARSTQDPPYISRRQPGGVGGRLEELTGGGDGGGLAGLAGSWDDQPALGLQHPTTTSPPITPPLTPLPTLEAGWPGDGDVADR